MRVARSPPTFAAARMTAIERASRETGSEACKTGDEPSAIVRSGVRRKRRDRNASRCYTGIAMSTAIPLQLDALKATSPKKATFIVLAVSVAALLLLVGVIYGHGRASEVPAWVAWLPALNAMLNGTSAVFLVLAYQAIRRRDVVTHSRRIVTSLGASALFLVSYIASITRSTAIPPSAGTD